MTEAKLTVHIKIDRDAVKHKFTDFSENWDSVEDFLRYLMAKINTPKNNLELKGYEINILETMTKL